MPVIQRETSVGAGVTLQNIFDGSGFEFAQQNQIVTMGVMAAATGSFVTIQAGAVLVTERTQPAIATRYPIVPDEMYYTAGMLANQRLRCQVENPTAGAIVHRAIAQIAFV